MDINIGSRIKYTFPNPVALTKTFAMGTVELVDEFHIMMLTDDNIRIKINFKNFESIEVLNQNGQVDFHEAI